LCANEIDTYFMYNLYLTHLGKIKLTNISKANTTLICYFSDHIVAKQSGGGGSGSGGGAGGGSGDNKTPSDSENGFSEFSFNF
jgi:hypothetical protein